MSTFTKNRPAPNFTGYATHYTYQPPGPMEEGSYKGDWVQGLPEGQGKWEGKDDGYEVTYEGEWRAGQFEGKGIMIQSNGDKYEGDFFEGQCQGRGILTWSPESRLGAYDGEWVADMMEGQGIYTARNGRQFTGHWSAAQLDGRYPEELEKEAEKLGPPSQS